MPRTLLNHWKSLDPFARWPLRGRELTAAFLRLGQKLFQPQIVNQPQRLSVALVSACAGLHTQEMRSSAQRIFGHYADKHGYDLHFFMDAMDVLRNLETNITLSNSPAFWRASKFRKNSAETFAVLWCCCPIAFLWTTFSNLSRFIVSLMLPIQRSLPTIMTIDHTVMPGCPRPTPCVQCLRGLQIMTGSCGSIVISSSQMSLKQWNPFLPVPWMKLKKHVW